MSEGTGQLQNYSVDQAAGAVVLVLGAVASLLLVIWQSKCHCKINLCYIFQCERRPPNEEEMKNLKDQRNKIKDKKDKKDKVERNSKEIKRTGSGSGSEAPQREPEPEPEPLLPKDNP